MSERAGRELVSAKAVATHHRKVGPQLRLTSCPTPTRFHLLNLNFINHMSSNKSYSTSAQNTKDVLLLSSNLVLCTDHASLARSRVHPPEGGRHARVVHSNNECRRRTAISKNQKGCGDDRIIICRKVYWQSWLQLALLWEKSSAWAFIYGSCGWRDLMLHPREKGLPVLESLF